MSKFQHLKFSFVDVYPNLFEFEKQFGVYEADGRQICLLIISREPTTVKWVRIELA